MRKLIIATTLIFSSLSILSQERANIEIKGNYLTGTKYYMGLEKVSEKKVMGIIFKNENAFKTFNSGKTKRGFATVISSVGGFLIGWPIGTALAGGDAKWWMAGAGFGITLIGLPIHNSGIRKMKKAIDIFYNDQSIIFIPDNPSSKLSLGFHSQGFGLSFVF